MTLFSKRFPFSETAIIGAQRRLPIGSVKLLEESDLSVDSSSIRLLGEIGRGILSTVYESQISGANVAVKIECFTTSVTRQTNLLVELSILQSLSHPRLVKLYGAGCLSKQLNSVEVRSQSLMKYYQ